MSFCINSLTLKYKTSYLPTSSDVRDEIMSTTKDDQLGIAVETGSCVFVVYWISSILEMSD